MTAVFRNYVTYSCAGSKLTFPDKVALLNSGKCGDTGNDGNGNNGTIQHITDTAQAIDYPEYRTCRITKHQANCSKESEGGYYVGNMLHPSRFFFA